VQKMCLVMSIRVHFGDGTGDEDELGNCFFDHLPVWEDSVESDLQVYGGLDVR
jgi:hypothetical protein